jgi:hypothetical protein
MFRVHMSAGVASSRVLASLNKKEVVYASKQTKPTYNTTFNNIYVRLRPRRICWCINTFKAVKSEYISTEDTHNIHAVELMAISNGHHFIRKD